MVQYRNMYVPVISDENVYPGIYHAASGVEEQIKINSNQFRIDRYIRSDILDSGENYIVRVQTGKVQKENMFIYSTRAQIVIFGIKNVGINSGNCGEKQVKLDFKHLIDLPFDADTNFVTAEFRPGLLTLYLSKKDNQMKNYPGRIILY